MNPGQPPRRFREKFVYPTEDLVLSAFVSLFGRVLWRLANYRRRLPRAVARADAAGIAVILHHYYSPAVTPSDLRYSLDVPRHLPGIDLDASVQARFLGGLEFGDELRSIPLAKPAAAEFGYQNGFFESGDAEILYGIIRRDRPKRLIEIGSGQSTLMARLAIRQNQREDPAYTCEHLCIEPYEAPWLESTGVTVLRKRVEEIDPVLYDALGAGDILFVDSSHTVRPQGDVLFEMFEIYPRLAPGVLVHIHDIFTPRDYREEWVIRRMHLWTEQYMLEAFLSDNPNYEIVCALNWLAHDHRELLRSACPVLLERFNSEPGSFWIRRK